MSTAPDTAQRTEDEIRAALAPRLALAKSRQEMTREAATLLFFTHGIYPSAKTVLGYTHRGSLTDINADLREFWNDLREKTRVKIEAPMLPDEVTALFSDGLAKIWDLSVSKAHTTLDGERQEAQDKIALAQRDATEADRLRLIADGRIEIIEHDRMQERGRRELADSQVAAQAAEISGLESSLAKWQGKAEAESLARRGSEVQFSQDLAAERATRTREAEAFAGEIRFCKMQIDATRTAEHEVRELLKIEKAERAGKDAEVNAYRQRANLADERVGSAQLELAQLKGRYEGLAGRFAEVQERLKGMSRGVKGVVAPVGMIKRRTLR